jgi:DNA-binding response OmpR family regulator
MQALCHPQAGTRCLCGELKKVMQLKILVVEDDKKTAELIKIYLEREGYAVLAVHDGARALELIAQRRPHLIVLDLMLPQVDGAEICRRVREESRVPIVMLTARSTEDDMLYGLDLGADDYIAKPFSPRELVARVRAVLRRTSAEQLVPALRFGPLAIDFVRHEVRLGGALVHLTPKEFKLLEILARQPGRAFSRGELVERVFGLDYEGFERTVDVHMLNLRKKIEADPSQPTYVLTVYGVGYKFAEEAL